MKIDPKIKADLIQFLLSQLKFIEGCRKNEPKKGVKEEKSQRRVSRKKRVKEEKGKRRESRKGVKEGGQRRVSRKGVKEEGKRRGSK